MTSFDTSEIIAWITVFLLVAAIPLTLLYFRYLNSQKSDSLLSKMQQKPIIKTKSDNTDLNFNFDNNWSSENPNMDITFDPDAEKKLAKIVLKTIALNGEMGMLIKQISDMLELHEIEVSSSLIYLTGKGFIESVNSQKGVIHYLTAQGTAYCSKKGYLSEVA